MHFRYSKPTNLFFVVIVLVGILLYTAFLSVINLQKSFSLNRELNIKIKSLEHFTKGMPFIPSSEMVENLAKEKKSLEKMDNEFISAFSKPYLGLKLEADPLKFKEDLFQTQNSIRQLALKAGFGLPDSLGFSKYETEIPTNIDVPVLKKQLIIVEELIKIMINSKVSSLKSIEIQKSVSKLIEMEEPVILSLDDMKRAPQKRPKSKITEPSEIKNKKLEIYQAFSIVVEVETDTANLIKFLYNLRASNYLFILNSLKIDSKKDETSENRKLKSTLNISAIIFSNKENFIFVAQ